MKKYLLILLVVLATQVFSQGRDDQYSPPPMQQNQSQNGTNFNLYSSKANQYKKMKTQGIVLLSVGAACAGGGAALLANGISTFNSVSSGSMFAPGNGGPQIVTGAALTIVGAVGVCLGTPLTIIGAVKSKKYKNQVSILFAPNACKIAYTF
jgi:hypothetical protein